MFVCRRRFWFLPGGDNEQIEEQGREDETVKNRRGGEKEFV